MVRTQIYLTDGEKKDLAALSKEEGKKQSELIREAIDRYIDSRKSERRLSVLKKLAGMWKDRDDLPAFDALREEWDREKRQ